MMLNMPAYIVINFNNNNSNVYGLPNNLKKGVFELYIELQATSNDTVFYSFHNNTIVVFWDEFILFRSN